jgi:hypothetical protein
MGGAQHLSLYEPHAPRGQPDRTRLRNGSFGRFLRCHCFQPDCLRRRRWRQPARKKWLVSTVLERGWTGRWPDDGNQVYSYPCITITITIGAKPWAPGPGNDSRFPRLWFTRTASAPTTPVVANISSELMIWSDYTPARHGTHGRQSAETRLSGRRLEFACTCAHLLG